MKLNGIIDRSDRKEIELVTRTGKHYAFPYAQMQPRPTAADPVQMIYVDPELASEGVTYFLASGEEGAVLLDHVFSLRKEEKAKTSHGRRYGRRPAPRMSRSTGRRAKVNYRN